MEKLPKEFQHAIETEKELLEQTIKWLDKIKAMKLTSATDKGQWMIKNINAYILDAGDFLKKKDYVRAFEAVVWAWSWYEIGLELEQLKK